MTTNNKDDVIDIRALLAEIELNEEEVIRSDVNKKAMDMKGVSNDHHRRALKCEESFLNGLRSVGKFMSL